VRIIQRHYIQYLTGCRTGHVPIANCAAAVHRLVRLSVCLSVCLLVRVFVWSVSRRARCWTQLRRVWSTHLSTPNDTKCATDSVGTVRFIPLISRLRHIGTVLSQEWDTPMAAPEKHLYNICLT